MADSFDPYRVWLGIPSEEQPPNFYRLLGVGTFESDPDVIASAADRQMAHVRTFQNGPRSALSQEMLNELSAANVCLLKPDKRAEYDKLLRSELAAKALLPAETPPAPPPPEMGLPVEGVSVGAMASSSRRSTLRTSARKKSSNAPIVVILTSAGGLLLLLLVVFAMNSGGGDRTEPKIPGSGQQESQSQAARSQPSAEKPRTPRPRKTTPKTAPPAIRPAENPVDLKPQVDPKPNEPITPDKAPPDPPAPKEPEIDWSRFPFTTVANAKPKRPGQPAPAVLTTARSRVRKIYKNEFLRARKREGRDALAGKLIAQAKATDDDSALRYVLLQEAHDLAIDVPNGGLLLDIIDQMAEIYDLDVLERKSVALARATRKTSDRAVLRDLLAHAKAVYQQAEAARRFDVAARVVRAARTMAKKAKDLQVSRDLDRRLRQLEMMEKSYVAAAKAATTLAKSPQDPTASLLMGRYLIGVEGDWQRGLRTLAQAGDSEWTELARGDLSNPPGPDEQGDLGDKWYALAKRTGTSRSPNVLMTRRAREWYVRAVGKLKGIEKVKIQQRIDEIDAVLN